MITDFNHFLTLTFHNKHVTLWDIFYGTPGMSEVRPCNYYFENKCRFSEEICWYKHKETVQQEEYENLYEKNFRIGFSECSGQSGATFTKRPKGSNKTILKNKIKRRTRRGIRKSKKTFEKSMRLQGVNAAGIRPKLMTFKKVLIELKSAIFS